MAFRYVIFAMVLLSSGYLAVSAKTPERPLGPFPLDGEIQDNKKRPLARLKIYHEYVETYSLKGELLFRVGVLSEKGRVQLYISPEQEPQAQQEQGNTLYGYAKDGLFYSAEGTFLASYAVTSTFSYIFDPQIRRMGRVKCIAWQRVCAVSAAAYFTAFHDPPK